MIISQGSQRVEERNSICKVKKITHKSLISGTKTYFILVGIW